MSELPLHDPLGRSRTEIKVEMTMAALVLLSAMSGNMLVVYFFVDPQGDLHVHP